uniref:ANK_REP_REGION domain-containing protein n=1 Tax=Macrostomum lignano TaxID=282301 RepID=A0A1I8FIV2_9PLAT
RAPHGSRDVNSGVAQTARQPRRPGSLRTAATVTVQFEEESATCWEPSPDDVQLVLAASKGDVKTVRRLLAETGADPCYQDHRTGIRSLWQRATQSACLLDNGAPWNAVDRQYHCAGEYATWNGHQAVVDLLLNHAAASELLLGALLSGERALGVTELQREYMRQRLTYCGGGDLLLDGEGYAVMMAWEQPLMSDTQTRQLHLPAARPARPERRFGMGITPSCRNSARPATPLLKAHPDVLARMRDQGWPDKPGVRIVSGRWQDVVADLGPFDGVFFDTYAEDDLDLHSFHAHLPRLLAPGGRYAFYNGMCPTMSSSTQSPAKLSDCGCSGSACGAPSGRFRSKWTTPSCGRGVRDRYWHFDTYYLPEVCRPEEEDSQSAAAPMDASS